MANNGILQSRKDNNMYYNPYDPASYKRKPLDRDQWHKPETSWLVICSIIFIVETIALIVYMASSV